MPRRLGVLWVLALTLGAVASPASATVVEALSLSDLVQASDHVVLASCERAEASYDERDRIVTDFTVRVVETQKGAARPGDELVIRRIGGSIGDLGMRIEGEPILEVGDRYLLFLRDTEPGEPARPVGMSQGVMRVDPQAMMVEPGGAGLTLRQSVSGGRLLPAPPALLHPEPYTSVRSRITSVVDAP